MARSRRRRSFTRRARVAADWVYRPNYQLADGTIIDDLGTWDPLSGTLLAGLANANFHVLYDSHNRFAQLQSQGLAPGISYMPNAARAEATRPKIMRVQGVIHYRPTAWAIGNILHWAVRFGIFEQDPQSGSVLIDPSFHILNAAPIAGAPMLRAATWANDRNWQRQFNRSHSFGDNGQTWTLFVNFAVNRRIDPNECYGIYMEASGGGYASSVNMFYQLWLRTLVSDEG